MPLKANFYPDYFRLLRKGAELDEKVLGLCTAPKLATASLAKSVYFHSV